MKKEHKRNKSTQKASPLQRWMKAGVFRSPLWFVVLLALLCDWNSWGHQFAIDDYPYVVNNPFILNPHNFLRIFVSPFVPAPSLLGLFYRPFTALTFGLNFWISGLTPDSFHVFNRLLHVLICVVIYFIVRRLIPRPRLAAPATALIFAAHPLQTEAVTYITGRSDELAMLFFLLALLFFIRYRSVETGSARDFVLSLLCYYLALLSKENAITWLGAVLLTELVYFSHRSWGAFLKRILKDWKVYAGCLAASEIFLWVRTESFKNIHGAPPEFGINPIQFLDAPTRILTALKVWFLCLGEIIWPLKLSCDYSFDQIPVLRHWMAPSGLIWVAAMLLFIALLVWSFLRSPHLFYGLGFFSVTYSIVSNIVVASSTIRGDRLLYLPLFGICLVFGVGWAWLYDRFETKALRRALSLGLIVILAALATRTILRNRDWKDQVTLFTKDLQVSPRSTRLLNNVGSIYFLHNQLGRAMELYQRAVAIAPDYPELLNNIASVYMKENRVAEAIPYFQRASNLMPTSPAYRSNYALALTIAHDYPAALKEYDLILQQDPRNALAHFAKGHVLYSLGNLDAAIREFRQTVEIDPHYPGAQEALDVLLKKVGHEPVASEGTPKNQGK